MTLQAIPFCTMPIFIAHATLSGCAIGLIDQNQRFSALGHAHAGDELIDLARKIFGLL